MVCGADEHKLWCGNRTELVRTRCTGLGRGAGICQRVDVGDSQQVGGEVVNEFGGDEGAT